MYQDARTRWLNLQGMSLNVTGALSLLIDIRMSEMLQGFHTFMYSMRQASMLLQLAIIIAVVTTAHVSKTHITHAGGSRCHTVITFICLSVFFPHDISKIDPAMIDHQTLHRNVPQWLPETRLFCGQKVKGQGHESQRHCRRGSLHSCECWLLVVLSAAAKPCKQICFHERTGEPNM